MWPCAVSYSRLLWVHTTNEPLAVSSVQCQVSCIQLSPWPSVEDLSLTNKVKRRGLRHTGWWAPWEETLFPSYHCPLHSLAWVQGNERHMGLNASKPPNPLKPPNFLTNRETKSWALTWRARPASRQPPAEDTDLPLLLSRSMGTDSSILWVTCQTKHSSAQGLRGCRELPWAISGLFPILPEQIWEIGPDALGRVTLRSPVQGTQTLCAFQLTRSSTEFVLRGPADIQKHQNGSALNQRHLTMYQGWCGGIRGPLGSYKAHVIKVTQPWPPCPVSSSAAGSSCTIPAI